jgi:KaiC/GvpD/RAD55 family RecA-like ATPase
MSLVSSGVSGLDKMLGGGFPKGKIIMVFGGPGTGKTILSVQYLMENMNKNEGAVYVSLEEPISNVKENVKAFGWDVQGREDEGLLKTLDLYMVPRDNELLEPIKRKGLDEELAFEADIAEAIEEVDAKHLIIDPITSLLIHEPRAGQKRNLISHIFTHIRSMNVTALITSEGMPSPGDFYMEQFLADGVILLEKNIKDFKLTKTIRIDKMRGMDFDDQPRRYTVTQRGFQVFHAEPVLV